jgi:hypothetical protein
MKMYMPLILAFFTSVIFTLPCLSNIELACEPQNEISIKDLPSRSRPGYKVDPYIDIAINLQRMASDKATNLLLNLVKDDPEGEKLIILCRMLYTAKPKKTFRRPSLGGPRCLGQTSDDDWLLEPIEIVDGIPFLIVTGYTIAGAPEPAKMYITYCIHNCDWNVFQFKPKSLEEKQKALDKLITSPKWKAPLTEDEKKFLSSQIK